MYALSGRVSQSITRATSSAIRLSSLERFRFLDRMGTQRIVKDWEADVLPLHHSRDIHKIEHRQQCIRLFAVLQLILFNCIRLHLISPRSGGKWG